MSKPKHEDPEPIAWHSKRLAKPKAPCPKHPKKDWQALVSKMWAAGWWIERGGSNYLKCYPPDDQRMISLPSTPSSPYTLGRKTAQARRSGLEV
jgi:hypothetical protein